jgi:hypothetical protein
MWFDVQSLPYKEVVLFKQLGKARINEHDKKEDLVREIAVLAKLLVMIIAECK